MKVGYQVLADLQQQQAFKQWGMNTIGSRTTRTEAYPLPYSEFCLPIVSGNGYVGGLNYGFGIGVTNFDLTSVTIVNNSEDSSYRWTGYTYIVVGAQPQWGKIAIGSTTVTYPLPYETYSLPVTVGLSPFYGSYYGNYYRPVLPSNPDLDGTALTTETIWEGFYIVVGQ